MDGFEVERISQRGNGERNQGRERAAERSGTFNDAPPTCICSGAKRRRARSASQATRSGPRMGGSPRADQAPVEPGRR